MEKKNHFSTPKLESETIESLSAKLLAATVELTRVNQELLRVQKEREEMLSNISHDLRAPITAIRSALDYLRDGEALSPEDMKSTIALIDRRTKTLEDLIQDMYYLFCVEDTSKELNFETVDVGLFLEEYFYDALADNRYDTHDMRLELPESLNCHIKIDIQKFVRVLDNLFTNASKYTPADSRICLSAALSPDSSLLQISVSDNGPGIPEEALPNIFNRTYTVYSARTPGAAGGSGLGLSIVKAIVERHGGNVSCQSNEEEGCCFTITIPVVEWPHTHQ